MNGTTTKLLKSVVIVFCLSALIKNASAQNYGEVHGIFQADAQYYIEDSAIGAPVVPEKSLFNAFGDLTFTKGNFKAGLRYEAYNNVLLGYDVRYKGNGIAHRYASYTIDELEVTIGNFYEQFGSGLILRTYWEPTLGYDNAFDGVRLKYNPYKGIYLKGLIGKQRFFQTTGDGIVRGFDGEINLNETFAKLNEAKTKLTLGGSFVSKYQKDEDPILRLPENVGSWAGRFNIGRGKINVNGEYVYKYNDPSSINEFSYKFGDAALIQATYSQKGLGILLAAKRIDNMNFRSDRNANLTTLFINYLPSLTKYQTYRLATIYPYATQPNGEIGYEAEVSYQFKKNTVVGGEYGANLILNYSAASGLKTEEVDGKDLYKSDYGGIGNDYYRDASLEFTKKINKKWKFTAMGIYQFYDKDVVENQGAEQYDTVQAVILIADITHKLTEKHALRLEAQHLQTEDDFGSWMYGLLEYTYSPNWFVAIGDMYNYGNEDSDRRFHYLSLNAGYTKNTTRIALGYGKQREGIFCVGGVCRNVPASNGFTLSIGTSF